MIYLTFSDENCEINEYRLKILSIRWMNFKHVVIPFLQLFWVDSSFNIFVNSSRVD